MCLLFKKLYLSIKLFSKISPTLSPFLPVLSMYVGPIPFNVEPIFVLPLAASEAASSNL